MTATDPGTVLAWVESPFQLLGALEAFASGRLGRRLDVLPRQDVGPLAVTVAELERLGLPAGVRVMTPGRAPHRYNGVLAVGDAFSGEVHRLLLQSAPRRLVLLDDGRSTKRVMDALVKPGVPLVRPHIQPTLARSLLAGLALARIKRMAAQGRVQVITALWLPEPVVAAAEAAGIRIAHHTFEWLRGLPGDALSGTETVVLGTSLVANNLIAAQPYLNWVTTIARGGPITYRPHRREDARTLTALAGCPGVVIETGQVPVEVSLRAMTARHRVFTLPTTAVSTLRLIAPTARIQEFAIPESWWQPSVPDVARRHLVPDPGEPEPSAFSPCS